MLLFFKYFNKYLLFSNFVELLIFLLQTDINNAILIIIRGFAINPIENKYISSNTNEAKWTVQKFSFFLLICLMWSGKVTGMFLPAEQNFFTGRQFHNPVNSLTHVRFSVTLGFAVLHVVVQQSTTNLILLLLFWIVKKRRSIQYQIYSLLATCMEGIEDVTFNMD
ncbi:Hypothetical_protein [Hexamita inflata]|uniref:Hypothetical_protein n=1 Tax=Hexamita inflata TaxID=28002 RepID=A0AA86PEI7_9EUKA|nr:Hypothetical protein HINF_LOCUS24206 [Hexamita inflata]